MCFDEELNDRKKKEQYLTDWLDGYKLAGECVPYVEKWKEQTQWEIDALSNAPRDSGEIVKGEMLDIFQFDSQHLQSMLPMIPEYNIENISSTDGSATTSTAYVYSIVVDIGNVPTDENKKYSELYTSTCQAIQRKYDILEEVRHKLLNLSFIGTSEILVLPPQQCC